MSLEFTKQQKSSRRNKIMGDLKVGKPTKVLPDDTFQRNIST